MWTDCPIELQPGFNMLGQIKNSFPKISNLALETQVHLLPASTACTFPEPPTPELRSLQLTNARVEKRTNE